MRLQLICTLFMGTVIAIPYGPEVSVCFQGYIHNPTDCYPTVRTCMTIKLTSILQHMV